MYAHPIQGKRLAVKVERIDWRSKKYKLTEEICMMKAGTLVLEKREAKIVDDYGNEVLQIGRFLWSAETIDPFHLVVDMF